MLNYCRNYVESQSHCSCLFQIKMANAATNYTKQTFSHLLGGHIRCMDVRSPRRKDQLPLRLILAVGYAPISCSAPRPLGPAYVPILLSEVEQEQSPSGNGDREAIVVGVGFATVRASVHTMSMTPY